MRNDLRTPKVGMAVALCVALTAIWLVALYGTYEESKREKYDVRVSPGAVTYGTHSSATVPMVSVPMHRSSVPMISGSAVRSYAHYGHASMPSTTSGSGFRMHTTSSATMHTIGSGGGGGSVGAASGSSSSSRGISYSGVSVSMPTLALATPTYATVRNEQSSISAAPEASAPGRVGHIRKAAPEEDGTDGEWRNGGEGENDWWYYDDVLGWIAPEVGDTRIDGGITYEWNGTSWVPKGDQGDPTSPTPLGDTPWYGMVLLLAMYGGIKVLKMRKKQKNLI